MAGFLRKLRLFGTMVTALSLSLCVPGIVYGQGQDFLLLRGPGSGIGVTIRDVAPSESRFGLSNVGVVVTGVTPGSSSAQADIKTGDVVIEFDGLAVTGARQFQRLVSDTPPAKRVNTVILREGRRITLAVVAVLGAT